MSGFLQTALCEALGIRWPVICAPMGALTGPELAAAVSNAGGLGIMGASSAPPELLRMRIRRVRELTDRPFGVNLILTRPAEERARVCFEERVPLLSLFWGDPVPYVSRAHELGMKVCIQVGTTDAAQEAAAAGVDFVIAQGMEGGGHTHGALSTLTVVPQIVDAVSPLPVAAAGGIADGRGLLAVLALGAQAAVLGTRFLATPEANAHARYKEMLLAAASEDTVRTTLFGGGWPNAPHRVLRTRFVSEWLAAEARGSQNRSDEPVVAEMRAGDEIVPIRRFMVFPPTRDTTGDVESMALYAGQSVGMLDRIESAGAIVGRIVAEAEQVLRSRLAPMLG